jgi:predicted permease
VVLGGAVGFLLLIVCANLANLSLSQSLGRARDFAVRAALGASRLDLIRETLVEHLAIGAIGAAAGVGVAAWSINIAVAVMPSEITTRSLNVIALDWRVVSLTIVIGIVTALLFGLPPALVASGASVTDVLRRDTRSATGSTLSRRLRSGLVVAEVSLSIVLLVGAALMTRSFMKLQAVDKGLNPTGLIALRLGLPAAGYSDDHVRDRFLQTAADRLRQLPGVTGSTIGTVPPLTSAVKFGQIEIADGAPTHSGTTIMPVYEVPPDFFSTLGIPFVEGRTFQQADEDSAAIVSRNFARQYWPDGRAVGRRFRLVPTDPWMTIIGVVSNVQDGTGAHGTSGSQLYKAFGRPSDAARPVMPGSTISAFRTLVVRAANPAAVALLLPGAIHAIDPLVVVDKREFVEHQFADAIARPRIVFLMMSVFALFALVLAAAGIYGVLSCLVAQRLREIGIRLALGASPRHVGRLILGNGLGLTAIGLAVGLVLALMLVKTMRSLLYQVEPTDPVSVALVSLLLFGTALLAAWKPMRRAMRVDPVNLLRED